MTNLWDEASRDHEEEFDTLQRSAAKVAVAQWWPVLAAAGSEREFGHRLAVVKDDIVQAMASAGVTARFQEETLTGLLEDYRVLTTARKEANAHGEVKTPNSEHWHRKVRCPDCNGTGAIPALGGEDPEDVDNGQVQCPTCKGTGEVSSKEASRKEAASRNLACGACGHTWKSRAQYRIKCPACGAEESVRNASRTAARIDTLRQIVDRHQHQEIDGMIVDVQTANLLIQVYDALSEGNKAKFDDLPLDRLVDLGWRSVASKKTAASGLSVGDQVIWTDFGVPDVKGKELVTYRGRNGEPWTITKIETLWDYGDGPTDGSLGYLPGGEVHLTDLVQDWIDRTGRSHLSTDNTEKIEMAHIERRGNEKVVPLDALVRSSVEVGAGQGLLPGLASKGWPEMPKAASNEPCFACNGKGYLRLPSQDPYDESWEEVTCNRCGGSGVKHDPLFEGDGYYASRAVTAESGWTGMDAVDEAGLHAGPEHCGQGNPACNWGWVEKDGQQVYRCSVHGTEQTKSHTASVRKTASGTCPRCRGVARITASRGNVDYDCMDCGEQTSMSRMAALRRHATPPSTLNPGERVMVYFDDGEESWDAEGEVLESDHDSAVVRYTDGTGQYDIEDSDRQTVVVRL